MENPKRIVKEYSNNDITVVWQPDKCIHSKICWQGLLPVFDPKKRPWVNMDGAPSAEIAAQVGKCPSGALSLKEEFKPKNTGNGKIEVTLLKNGPLMVKGDCLITDADGNQILKEKNTAFCRCGASTNKPFCDGTHRKIEFIG